MSEERKHTEKIHADVMFGRGDLIGVAGIVGGVALALGFSWIVLAHGQTLGTTLAVIFVLAGLFMGGLVALVSAFFGLVMPRQVGGGAPSWVMGEIKEWIKRHKEWDEVDWEHWTEQDWKAWAEKKKKEDL
jgi:apolipoprotein N-acyltransferase